MRLLHCTCPLLGVKRTSVTSYSASKSASFKWTWRRFVGGGFVRRRDFIAIAGSAAAWPLATRAQQPTRVVGFLRPTKAEEWGIWLPQFGEGLRESGYPRDQKSNLVGGTAETNNCQNLPVNWLPFLWRQLLPALFRRRGQQRQPRQAFRLFS